MPYCAGVVELLWNQFGVKSVWDDANDVDTFEKQNSAAKLAPTHTNDEFFSENDSSDSENESFICTVQLLLRRMKKQNKKTGKKWT